MKVQIVKEVISCDVLPVSMFIIKNTLISLNFQPYIKIAEIEEPVKWRES